MASSPTTKRRQTQPPAKSQTPRTPRSASPADTTLVPTDAAVIDAADREITQQAVLIDAGEMAAFLQQHLGQKLTAYLAGINDVKAVGQWAAGRADPSAIVRERLRAAYHVTALFAATYGDRAAQGWFFGANAALDDQAPAAMLRTAETPAEIARVVPLARAFIRSAL
jgi:hypothetical protein